MSGRYRCIVYSPVGVGDIEGPLDADCSMKGQGEMLCGFLDALGISSAHFVGNDTGGAIAQAVAAYAPHYVDRLVLSDCDALDNWPPLQLRLLRLALAIPGMGALLAVGLRVPALARTSLAFGRLYHSRDILTADRIERLRRPYADSRRRARFRRLLDAMDSATTMAMVEPLGRFSRPTMIVWGRHNAYWPTVWADRLAEVIGGTVRVEILDDAGLTGCEERPDAFCRLLEDFLCEENSTQRSRTVESARESFG